MAKEAEGLVAWSIVVDYVSGMSIQMNIAEAKAKLSELVARAEAGEDVVIARDGKPAVRLTRASASTLNRLGALAHLGPLENPNGLLQPDPELDDQLDAPLWPAGAERP